MSGRIGVFVCECQGLVSDHLATERVAEAAAELDGVEFVERRELLCGEADWGRAVRQLHDRGCDRLLFVGCSPRSSLKFPEERISRLMQTMGLDPGLFEVANVREQCAWQHRDRQGATGKAVDLVRMAHARLRADEPVPPAVPIPQRALVVGAGPAGLQAAQDLAAAGIGVTLVEQKRWLGGRLCQLQRVFQTEGWPSVCDSSCIGPVQAKGVLLGPGIEALTQTTVVAAERHDGGFRVTFEQAPRFVDPDRCICCGECGEVCPELTPREYDEGLSQRKAIDKEFERALPDAYDIVAAACTMCGDCVPVCPTGCIDLEAQVRRRVEDYGAVLLATGSDPIDLSDHGRLRRAHPDVVTALEFERIMDDGFRRPSDGRVVEQVAFVQCAGSRMGPERRKPGVAYCSKTCCAVTAKQVDRLIAQNPMAEPTVIYYRDLRTYERALEELHQRLRVMGFDFINGEVAAIEVDEEGALQVTVEPRVEEDEDADEPAEDTEPRSIEADLVVLAAAQIPARGSSALYRIFGVETDRYGFPIENQPRVFRPTESLVDRVFVFGSSAGPKVVQQAAEQGSVAAMRALPTLLAGQAEAPRYASRIRSERCTSCRTCEAVCPHGAIRMTASGVISDPAFCQACGFCAAACPVHAAELTSFSDQQILAQAEVAFRELPAGAPRILALLCYWCSYSAADFAGIERAEAPTNYRVVRTRCSSSVNTALLLGMFELGVDGILVAGCPERSCHHLWGNFVADKRIDLARALLEQLGVSPARLRFEYIGAPMQHKLLETLRSMDQKLRQLGPNPAGRRRATPRTGAAS